MLFFDDDDDDDDDDDGDDDDEYKSISIRLHPAFTFVIA